MFFSNYHWQAEKELTGWQKNPSWLKWVIVIALSISAVTGYRTIRSYFYRPEAVFVLGGHEAREKFAGDLARKQPHLEIWVSSGSPRDYAQKIFAFRGIAGDRLYLDYQAQDTVTNFTTLVDELKARGIDSVYLVTSDNHMTRARIIGEIVFGSRGIAIEPLAVPSGEPPEPIEKSLRDSARAILWLTTGYTGENLNWFKQNRERDEALLRKPWNSQNRKSQTHHSQ